MPQRECIRSLTDQIHDVHDNRYNDILACQLVEASGVPNFQGCKIVLDTHFNLDNWEKMLLHYHDKAVIQFLKFGFPISFDGILEVDTNEKVLNHKGAT